MAIKTHMYALLSYSFTLILLYCDHCLSAIKVHKHHLKHMLMLYTYVALFEGVTQYYTI